MQSKSAIIVTILTLSGRKSANPGNFYIVGWKE
jgi:hypothetical protein